MCFGRLLTALKPTWHLNVGSFRRKLVFQFQPSIFRCYVSFRDGTARKTTSSPLKNHSWKTSLSFWVPQLLEQFRGVQTLITKRGVFPVVVGLRKSVMRGVFWTVSLFWWWIIMPTIFPERKNTVMMLFLLFHSAQIVSLVSCMGPCV